MEVKNIIKIRRQELGYTLEELGNLVGVGKSTVRKWETGIKKNIKRDKIALMAKVLNVSPAALLGIEEYSTSSNSKTTLSNIHPITTQKVPILKEMCCGELVFEQEECLLYVIAGTEIKADFAFIYCEDSMKDARISNGDMVFICKQEIVNNGEIAAIMFNSEIMLKRFYRYQEKNIVILKSANSSCEDIILSKEQFVQYQILGKVVAFQSCLI